MTRSSHRSGSLLWRSVVLSTLALMVPLGVIYFTSAGDPAEKQPVMVASRQRLVAVAAEPISLVAPQISLLQPGDPAPPSQGVFHLCEEKGQLVYKIRLKANGDEMTVDAHTGKLINVTTKS